MGGANAVGLPCAVSVMMRGNGSLLDVTLGRGIACERQSPLIRSSITGGRGSAR
jgi:hypothetical protein